MWVVCQFLIHMLIGDNAICPCIWMFLMCNVSCDMIDIGWISYTILDITNPLFEYITALQWIKLFLWSVVILPKWLNPLIDSSELATNWWWIKLFVTCNFHMAHCSNGIILFPNDKEFGHAFVDNDSICLRCLNDNFIFVT